MHTAKNQSQDRLITRDIALVMAAAFCFFASNMLVTPLMAGYAESLGAAGAIMGLASGMMSIISLFCRPIAGLLSDRASKRLLVGIGAGLYLASNLWYAAASNPVSLIGARMVNGVGFACVSVCLATWMSLLLPIHHMGAGMGLYGTMNALAMAIGPAIGIKAQKIIGYRHTFLISAALAVLMVAAIFLVKNGGRPVQHTGTIPSNGLAVATNNSDVKHEHHALPAQASTASHTAVSNTNTTSNPLGTSHTRHTRLTPHRVVRMIIEPRVVPLSLVFMLFALPYFANQSFLVTYVQARALHVEASLFFPLYAIALLVMRLAMRDLFDHWSFRRFLLGCSVCLLGMLACLTVMTNDWLLLLAGILTAGSYGIMSSVTQSQAVLIAGRERSGIANSTYYIGIDLGMSLGPLIAGFLYQHAPIAWFYPVFALTVPLALILYFVSARIIHARDARSVGNRDGQ